MKNNIGIKLLFALLGVFLGFVSFTATKSISLSVLEGILPAFGSAEIYQIFELVVFALFAFILYLAVHKAVSLTMFANSYRTFYVIAYFITVVLMFIRWGFTT